MRWIAIAWAPLVALAAGGSAAQDEHSQPSNPADVRLTARIRGGETTFHLGEVIPLELSFTSPTEKKYELDMAGYDRSGRLGEETFAIKPESGWHDPLYLYFHAYQGIHRRRLARLRDPVLQANPGASRTERMGAI